MRNTIVVCIAGIMSCALLVVRCVPNFAGTSSGSEARMASVKGKIVDGQGVPASNTVVRLVPVSYDPVNGPTLGDSLFAITDEAGEFVISTADSGVFNIQAVRGFDGMRCQVWNVNVRGDTIMAADTLHKPGAIRILLLDSTDSVNGFFYVPGTTVKYLAQPVRGAVVLDSIGSDSVPSVKYEVQGSAVAPRTIGINLVLLNGDTLSLVFGLWQFSKTLMLNTTASGADVAGDVMQFQVLVRLTNANFAFSQAQKNGADIRFSKSDNTQLPYEIEQWDSAGGSAALWVYTDTVHGNNSTQSILMYWGNPNALAASNGAGAFDTAKQCQAVWHLQGASTDTVQDATANHYYGIPHNLTAGFGVIGGGQQFDGVTSYITMPGTAASKLNYPEKGVYSVSAWVNTDTLDGQFHTIASKGDKQYNLSIMYQYNAWEFSECRAAGGYTMVSSPATPHEWTFVMGVRNGDKQYIYVNGICTDSTIIVGDTTFIRSTSDDFAIGKMPNGSTYYFNGMIDEVRVSSAAHGADWAKLSYMNQKPADALVVFK